MAQTLISPEIAASVIRRPPRRSRIAARDIQKFCVAIDDPDPVYLDVNAARAAGYRDIIAPPLFPAAATRPVPWRGNLLVDGQYDDLAPPGLQHLQSILAGQEWEFFRPALVGEDVVDDVSLGSIEERQGRSGPMVFAKEESLISTEGGDPIVRQVNTLIFRPHPSNPTDSRPQAAPAERDAPATTVAPDGLIKRPDMVAAFMFAAATWAVHRIHWDVPYAQSEGLPSAILPGWMGAAYLCQLAKTQAPEGAVLRTLSVRYQQLALPGDILTCRANDKGEAGRLGLSITNQAGVVIMSGDASFQS